MIEKNNKTQQIFSWSVITVGFVIHLIKDNFILHFPQKMNSQCSSTIKVYLPAKLLKYQKYKSMYGFFSVAEIKTVDSASLKQGIPNFI